jgi:hypothetical protein
MPMYKNIKDNRFCDPLLIGRTLLFLHSVLDIEGFNLRPFELNKRELLQTILYS